MRLKKLHVTQRRSGTDVRYSVGETLDEALQTAVRGRDEKGRFVHVGIYQQVSDALCAALADSTTHRLAAGRHDELRLQFWSAHAKDWVLIPIKIDGEFAGWHLRRVGFKGWWNYWVRSTEPLGSPTRSTLFKTLHEIIDWVVEQEPDKGKW